MKEKDVQTLFGRKNQLTGVFELKLVKGKSMPFKAVQDHQIAALWNANGRKGLYHKISDMSMGEKPFDCFYLTDIPAYVVPVFYIPRKQKTAYYIRIDRFLRLAETASRESMTEEMAKSNSEFVVEL